VTYPEAIEFLFGLRWHGQKLGLDTMRELLALLGNPQDGLRFIHIAGTNGKGSVAAMCHSVLLTAGIRTGLYTSPHLVSFCERFQINGQLIAPDRVVSLVERLRPLLTQTTTRPPTFFEVVTAMALVYFREENVEVVVWETGLGGRLDATNVVTPLVSVITTIGFDHMQYLGDTLASIAGEKAGIIKPGVPVVTGTRETEALRVIRETSAQRGCRLTEVREPLDWEIPLAGNHQRWNCATAVAALQATGLPVTMEQMRAGVRRTRWPGRFQVIRENPVVILDGAHNGEAAQVLAATIREKFPSTPVALILGVLRDKDYAQVCRILAPLARWIYCVPVQSERTCDPAELAALCRGLVRADLATAYAEALMLPSGVIVITGSLFLVGEALGLATPGSSARERALQ
jgi:dihydrofolate synthase/folylpolyglutamate synthase